MQLCFCWSVNISVCLQLPPSGPKSIHAYEKDLLLLLLFLHINKHFCFVCGLCLRRLKMENEELINKYGTEETIDVVFLELLFSLNISKSI